MGSKRTVYLAPVLPNLGLLIVITIFATAALGMSLWNTIWLSTSADLRQNMTSIQQDIAVVKQAFGNTTETLQVDIDALRAQINQTQADLDAAEEKVRRLNDTIAALQTSIENQIGGILASIATIESSDLPAIQATLAQLQTEIDALQNMTQGGTATGFLLCLSQSNNSMYVPSSGRTQQAPVPDTPPCYLQCSSSSGWFNINLANCSIAPARDWDVGFIYQMMMASAEQQAPVTTSTAGTAVTDTTTLPTSGPATTLSGSSGSSSSSAGAPPATYTTTIHTSGPASASSGYAPQPRDADFDIDVRGVPMRADPVGGRGSRRLLQAPPPAQYLTPCPLGATSNITQPGGLVVISAGERTVPIVSYTSGDGAIYASITDLYGSLLATGNLLNPCYQLSNQSQPTSPIRIDHFVIFIQAYS